MVHAGSSRKGSKLNTMRRSTKRLVLLLAALPTLVVVMGTLYMLGMSYFEDTPRTFWSSLEWASETLTTTGYGGDSHWRHPVMNLFVMFVQVTGMSLAVMVFPIYVLPYLEERLQFRLPRTLPSMEDTVLVHRYGPAIDSLVEELKRSHIPFVVLEKDEALARGLQERGFRVVLGKLEEEPHLMEGVEKARALIANADDHSNGIFIMMARERGFDGPLLALAENPIYRAPMEKIGATAVFTPAHVLAAALAARASILISPRQEGLHVLGGHVGLVEFRIHHDSTLAGRRLGDLHMREQHGVTVIGQWIGGAFQLATGPDTRIEAGAILVAVGAHASLERFERMATPLRTGGHIVICGHGAVGGKVAQMLNDAGERTVVIDRAPGEGVDVVGDVLDHSTLDRARVHEATAVVIALSNDSLGVFATAVVRDYAPQIPLVARVNRAPNVPRLYQAGADFSLSLGQISGQILAHHLLHQDALMLEQRLKFARVAPGTLVGAHPWRAEVREKTGAAIVAAERGSEVKVEFEPDFRIRVSDVLFVCGTTESMDRYRAVFKTTAVAD